MKPQHPSTEHREKAAGIGARGSKARETPASPREETGEPPDNVKKQLEFRIGDKRTHYMFAIDTHVYSCAGLEGKCWMCILKMCWKFDPHSHSNKRGDY